MLDLCIRFLHRINFATLQIHAKHIQLFIKREEDEQYQEELIRMCLK